MYKSALLFSAFLLFLSVPSQAAETTAQNKPGLIRDLSSFFGVPEDQVSIECKPDTFMLKNEGGVPVLSMCLNAADHEKRCEIAVHGLVRAPYSSHVSYDVNFADTQKWDRWLSVMQLHAFPDYGEQWRCPVSALEVQNGRFRMYNRWDSQKISTVSGNNCTEPGNSISGRTVLEDVPVKPGQWQSIRLDAKLSAYQEGEFQLTIVGHESPFIKGPNTYNDKRDNFLKFGIYNPAGFEEGHALSCVKYRNVKITTDKNK